MLTLGSLFDGIAGFPESARRHGIKALWASEIEPFPIMVSKAHFPDMEQKGSIIDINGAELEPVDIITFGSPCQDLSVAGKREGLDGERSHLFFEAVDRINEMRKRTHKCYPSFAIWENVPGALSSNGGRDFRAVLEALTEAKIPMPPSGRWAESGMVRGNGREVAWRCLDAQYWGVPQRRKRIFLVVDFGGDCASEILFEPESVSRDFEEGRKAREEVAACAGDGFKGTECFGVSENQRAECRLTPYIRNMTTNGGKPGQGYPCVVAFNGRQDPVSGTVTGALDTDGLTQCVAQCVTTGTGRRYDPETETLITVPVPVLADQGGSQMSVSYDLAPTLRAQEHGHQPLVIDKPQLYDMTHTEEVMRPVTPGLAPTLNARMGTGGNQIPVMLETVAHAVDCRNLCENEELSGTLQCKQSGGYSLNYQNPVRIGYAVRRLTPLECERLQGLPDGWTDIHYTLYDKRGRPRPKQATDTARYKAIGNGLAIVCPDWIFERMNDVLYSEIPEVVNR